MLTTTSRYVPPIVSNLGQEGHSEDLANLAVKRKLTKKNIPKMMLGTDKLYGYEGGGGGGGFAAFAMAAANVIAVVNAVVYSNAAAVVLAVAIAAVVTFPGNMQGITPE